MRNVEWLAILFETDRSGSPDAHKKRLPKTPPELYMNQLWFPWWPSPNLAWHEWGDDIEAGRPCPFAADKARDRDAWIRLAGYFEQYQAAMN